MVFQVDGMGDLRAVDPVSGKAPLTMDGKRRWRGLKCDVVAGAFRPHMYVCLCHRAGDSMGWAETPLYF